MPHREQAIQDPCGLCDAVAVVACERCRLPLCATHRPAPDALCTDCEGELYVKDAKIGRMRGALTSLGVAAGSAVGSVAAFALAGWGTTVLAGTIGVAVTAFTALQSGKDSRSKRRRKKFLRERKPKYESALDEPEKK